MVVVLLVGVFSSGANAAVYPAGDRECGNCWTIPECINGIAWSIVLRDRCSTACARVAVGTCAGGGEAIDVF